MPPICKSLWMHVMYLGPFVHLRRELYRSQTDPKYKNSKNSIYSFIPIYMSRTVLYFGDKFQSICIFIFPGIIIQLNLLPHIFLDSNKSMPFGFSSLRTPFKRKKQKSIKSRSGRLNPLIHMPHFPFQLWFCLPAEVCLFVTFALSPEDILSGNMLKA